MSNQGGKNVKSAGKRKRPFRKSAYGRLYNKRVLAVLALLVSIVLWSVVKLNITKEETSIFADIPIDFRVADISTNFGLEKIETIGPPSYVNDRINVTARGSLYQLSRTASSDITVTALQTGTIDKPGVYRMSLSVASANGQVTVSLPDAGSYVTVRFDRIKTIDFTLDQVTIEGASVDHDTGFLISQPFSTVKTITVSGPETEMSAISSVEIHAEVNKVLTNTENFPGRIIFKDADGNELGEQLRKYIEITRWNDFEGAPNEEDLIVTVPVNKTVELPVTVTIKRAPPSFDPATLAYTISPSVITLGGKIDAIDALAEVGYYELPDSIDLSQLRVSTSTQLRGLNLSSGISEMNDVSEVTITFNMSGYTEKTLNLSKGNTSAFQLINVPDGVSASILTDRLENVVVTGPAASIDRLTAYMCTVEVDMSSIDTASGQKMAAASLTFPELPDCWAVGTYQVKVAIE